MACSAIWHLVELCHENRGLAGARTMVAVENDRCLLFEDHVQGELMALMGDDEAAYVVFSIKNTTKTNEITFSTDVYFAESKDRKLASVHLIGAWI